MTTAEMTDAPLLSVRGLRKAYASTVAVSDVSFDVRGGELLGVIGPNGAGKSTTVKAITGQLVPDAGEIAVAGRRIDTHPVEARQLTGYVPQKLALYPFLTGREILRFVASVRELPEDRAEARAGELLERLGLTEAADRLAREYSEGMARKLAVATALLSAPPLLVLDESLTGLDPRAAAEVKALVRSHVGDGGAVLLVSHQLAALERLCSRVLLIDRGQVEATLDRPELDEMRERGETLEAFFLDRTGPTRTA